MTEELNKPNFHGKWDHLRSENFEDFMRENGANYVVRKMASHSNPTVDISQDGEKFHIKLHSLFVTRESTFTVGDEYEETQHNGTVMKVKPCWEDEKLVLTYEPKVEGTATSQKHTRELDSEGNEMTLTLEVGGVVAAILQANFLNRVIVIIAVMVIVIDVVIMAAAECQLL